MTIHKITLVLLAASLLAGCTQWRHYELGEQINQSDVPRPEDGWTTSQVMGKFGPPIRMSSNASGYVMAWEYWVIDEYKVGIGSFISRVDLVSIDWGKASARGDFMLLSFDHEHQLTAATFEKSDRDAGGGQGVQPGFSLIDLVEVGDLTVPLSQHLWGAQSLRRIPVTLNQQNRLDTGNAGIEQRGGTSGVGQHSLEHR